MSRPIAKRVDSLVKGITLLVFPAFFTSDSSGEKKGLLHSRLSYWKAEALLARPSLLRTGTDIQRWEFDDVVIETAESALPSNGSVKISFSLNNTKNGEYSTIPLKRELFRNDAVSLQKRADKIYKAADDIASSIKVAHVGLRTVDA